MLWWLLGAYAVFFMVLTGTAAGVTLFVSDKDRAERAFRVLKLVFAAGSGLGLVAGTAVKLLGAGLL